MVNNEVNNKKYIIISIIILVILFVIFGVYFYSYLNSKDSKIALAENMKKSKGYDSLKITNIRAVKKDGDSHLQFTVNNQTDTIYKSKEIYIVFFDENNSVINKQKIIIPLVEARKTSEFDMIFDKKIFKADNFKIADE